MSGQRTEVRACRPCGQLSPKPTCNIIVQCTSKLKHRLASIVSCERRERLRRAEKEKGYGVLRCMFRSPHLSVYFVKWSSIREARVPDLVDDLCGLDVILAPGTGHDGLDGTLADAVLELLGQSPVASRESLASPATFTAEHRCSNLLSTKQKTRDWLALDVWGKRGVALVV